MIQFKEGVSVNGVQPEMAMALHVIGSVYAHMGYYCTVTSGTDGSHSKNSLHYAGLAVDTRTRDIAKEFHKELTRRLREALGSEFDVVLESDHIHIEYDPKCRT